MRKIQFINKEFYHIYNRGVDKRVIFNDEADYYRFIFQMYVCNIGSSIKNMKDSPSLLGKKILTGNFFNEKFIIKNGFQKVNIVAFCLMPNHFHLILQQNTENGISEFMQKLGTSYSMYFNLRNQRSGRLFEGTFKAIHIENENYLLHLSRYVHINPLKLLKSNWSKRGVIEIKGTNNVLESYKWSSYPDYIGERKSKITDKNILNYYFDYFNQKGIKDYKEFVNSWIAQDITSISHLTLE